MNAITIKKELRKYASKKKAKILQGFFKTGPGEYGEGDIFIGVVVPDIRATVKKFRGLPLAESVRLLQSKIHEERLTALLLLVDQYRREDEKKRKQIFDIYLKHHSYINNWDLIDLTAEHIVGAYLKDLNKDILYRYARSKDLWCRRIAMLSTFHYIKQGDFKDALAIGRILLNDEHDLIHKAVGWLLREIGKRNLAVEEKFLKKHYKLMSRTMLRYAIERFPEKKRQAYLKGKIDGGT